MPLADLNGITQVILPKARALADLPRSIQSKTGYRVSPAAGRKALSAAGLCASGRHSQARRSHA